MQIRSGRLKGRRLTYPRAGLRPTKDITRQAVFNIIGSAVQGARVCDLYAGGGALGIEALSRGAAEAVFVEQSPFTVRFLRENVKGLEAVRVIRGEALSALKRLGRNRFEILLADPPYRNALVQATLDRAVAVGTVPVGGLFVVEHHELEPPDCPEGWTVVKRGRYGDSFVTVLKREDA